MYMGVGLDYCSKRKQWKFIKGPILYSHLSTIPMSSFRSQHTM